MTFVNWAIFLLILWCRSGKTSPACIEPPLNAASGIAGAMEDDTPPRLGPRWRLEAGRELVGPPRCPPIGAMTPPVCMTLPPRTPQTPPQTPPLLLQMWCVIFCIRTRELSHQGVKWLVDILCTMCTPKGLGVPRIFLTCSGYEAPATPPTTVRQELAVHVGICT